ncbi:MAG: hypothetical protein IT557_03210 [Alphaproteobacteria bacterium]|nr:hypothetical protein [Alphaproteobacteria bacterium]
MAAIAGGGGDDVIFGTDGDDQLLGNNGNDFIDGGAGNDTIYGNNGSDLLDGGAGSDTVTGGAENDTILGGEGDDALYGLGGNDHLDGGAGADLMRGGKGDDTYVVDDAGDVTGEFAGEGTDLVMAWADHTIGANIEDLTLLGTADINGTGNAVNNVITGNSGSNRLSGMGGDDIVLGGEGNDILAGNDGNDQVFGQGGDDRIGGHAGDDYLDGGEGNDTVDYTAASGGVTVDLALAGPQDTGSDGFDTIVDVENIRGSSHDDLLSGNDAVNEIVAFGGNDHLDGRGGADLMYGGAGDDTYVVDEEGDVTSDASGTDTILSMISLSLVSRTTIENLTLVGPAAVDGTGNALDNVITGNDNANTLDGRAGADTLAGGAGDDIYLVDDAGDTVIEGAGEGTDMVLASASHTLGDNVENLTLTLTGAAITGTGNALDNVIIGNNGNNRLNGMGGNDTIHGGLGSDTLAGNDGDDVIHGEDGNDRIGGQDGNDQLDGGAGTDIVDYTSASAAVTVDMSIAGPQDTGGAGTDTLAGFEWIYGSAYSDVLVGDDAANVLTGFGGDDMLDGGLGADKMYGGAGNDTYIVESVGDVTSDTSGVDTIVSSVSISLVYRPSIENLTLVGSAECGYGNDHDNRIVGSDLHNDLCGGDGNDTLVGGGDYDCLYGGAGADTFHYNALSDSTADFAGRDVIYDFSEADGDKVDLSALDADAGVADDQAFSFVGTAAFSGTAGELRYEESGTAGLIVWADTNGDAVADFSIRFHGLSSITDAAFAL